MNGGQVDAEGMADPIRRVCDELPLGVATTLPATAYRSGPHFDLEVSAVLRPGWHCVGRLEQVLERNSYCTVDVMGTPLVMTRDSKGEIRVLSRTCRHRWMEVAQGSGEATMLTCGYHRWSYGLDGRLLQAPLMDGTEGFNRQDVCLPAFRHSVWHGFVLVDLVGDAEPFDRDLQGLDELLAPYDLSSYRSVERRASTFAFDWKVMVENFVECYHHLGTHAETLGREYPVARSKSLPGADGYLAVASHPRMAPGKGVSGEANGTPEQHMMLIIAIFPLFVLAVTAESLVWYRIDPTGPGAINLDLDICVSSSSREELGFPELRSRLIADVLTVHEQDMATCSAVQRGLAAEPGDSVGRLSPAEQPLWEFYRYLGRMFSRFQSGVL